MLTASLSFAQKVKFEEVIPLMESEEYDPALPILLNFLDKKSQHAYAHYQVSQIYFHRLKKVPAPDRAHFQEVYVDAQNYLEMAIYLAKKKELRKNRKYYENELGVFKPSLEAVQFFYQQRLSDLNTYYMKVMSLYTYEDRIRALYRHAEDSFDGLAAAYTDMPDLLFRADIPLLDTLADLRKKFDSLHWYRENREKITVQKGFEDFAKQYLFNGFENFQARRVTDEAFQEPLVVLYDYGKWSGLLAKKIREEVMPLKALLPEADRRLEAALVAVGRGHYAAGLEESDMQLVYQLFQYDGTSLAAKLLLYKRLKVEYLILKANVEQAFDSLDIAVDPSRLHKKIEECQDVLRHIQADPAELRKYQAYIKQAYGGQAQLTAYLEGEQSYLAREKDNMMEPQPTKQQGRRSAQKPVALSSPVMPRPSLRTFRQTTLNEDSLIAFGGFVTTNVLEMPGSEKLVAGVCPNTDQLHKDAFLAKLNQNQEVVWFRRFMQKNRQMALNHQVRHISNNQQFATLMGLELQQGSMVNYRVAVVADNGELLFNRPVPGDQMLREAMLTDEDSRAILVTKGKWQQDQFDQLEACKVTLLNQFGKIMHTDSIVFKGIFTQMLPLGNGFVMAGNFLQMYDLDGRQVESGALSKGGFNVFLAFFNKNGHLGRIVPIVSEVPLLAQQLVAEPSGSILIKGLKGNYILGSTSDIRGGEPWEYRF